MPNADMRVCNMSYYNFLCHIQLIFLGYLLLSEENLRTSESEGKRRGSRRSGERETAIEMYEKRIIKEMEGKISATEDTAEGMDTLENENIKSYKNCHKGIWEVWDIIKRENLRTVWIEKRGKSQVEDTENIFNKIREEHLSDLMNEMPIKVQEA